VPNAESGEVTCASPSIRPAESRDGIAIARINVAAWEAAYPHVFGPARLEARRANVERAGEWWAEKIGSQGPPHRTLVAEQDQQVVGFTDTGPSRDDDADQQQTGEVNLIYVLPERWGGGIGQALMARALKGMRQDGFRDATLWVLQDNPLGRRFYEAGGWWLDGAFKEDEFLETRVTEVRYRITLQE
jgi:GNAT superfamily N-acetyltransferase